MTSFLWRSADYELDWPPELLAGELMALIHRPYRAWTGDEVMLLLREAFHTETPAADFARLHSSAEWDNDPAPTQRWLTDLLDNLTEVRPYSPPRSYWPARQAGLHVESSRTPEDAPSSFAFLIRELDARGYLDRDFSDVCIDVDPDEHYSRDLNLELRGLLHDTEPSDRKLWPLQPETWDTDTFYGLIEVFHDLVARPRYRWEHDHGDCGPHFQDFDTEAGRRVYRALVNRLLAENHVDLRLATGGEDEGRLVRVVDEARADLVERTLRSPDPTVVGRIRHAVAQFRGRSATVHDKRSAVLTLTGILEERRELIKEKIGKKDEGALFGIANEFAIRHQRRGQQGDYDPMFLDWIFWWYLGTVELTDRLLARQVDGEASA